MQVSKSAVANEKQRSTFERKLVGSKTFPELTKAEIFDAIKYEQHTSSGLPGQQYIIGPSFWDDYLELEQLASLMLKSKKPIFASVRIRPSMPVEYVSETISSVCSITRFLSIHTPEMRRGERSELFLLIAAKVGLLREPPEPGVLTTAAGTTRSFPRPMIPEIFIAPHYPSNIIDFNQAELINLMGVRMRDAGQAAPFVNRVNKRAETAASNFASARSLISSLFVRHPKLTVASLEFGYAQSSHRVSDAQAQADLQHFRINQRGNPRHFGSLVGCIWHWERGIWSNGPHFRLWLFFDAARLSSVEIADAIGQYWVNIVTRGRGLYSNCLYDSRPHRQDGLGLIEQTDMEQRIKLDVAMQRLTRRDEWLKPIVNGRVFGTSSV